MIDRMWMWEVSQTRRRDLLESAGVAGRKLGVHDRHVAASRTAAFFREGTRVVQNLRGRRRSVGTVPEGGPAARGPAAADTT